MEALALIETIYPLVREAKPAPWSCGVRDPSLGLDPGRLDAFAAAVAYAGPPAA